MADEEVTSIEAREATKRMENLFEATRPFLNIYRSVLPFHNAIQGVFVRQGCLGNKILCRPHIQVISKLEADTKH